MKAVTALFATLAIGVLIAGVGMAASDTAQSTSRSSYEHARLLESDVAGNRLAISRPSKLPAEEKYTPLRRFSQNSCLPPNAVCEKCVEPNKDGIRCDRARQVGQCCPGSECSGVSAFQHSICKN